MAQGPRPLPGSDARRRALKALLMMDRATGEIAVDRQREEEIDKALAMIDDFNAACRKDK